MRSLRQAETWVRIDPRGQVVRAELGVTRSSMLAASVAESGAIDGFVPAFALIAKAKRFDDRFVATIDRAAHSGIGPTRGWPSLIATLRGRVHGAARGLLDAAASFLGASPATEIPERLAASKWRRPFEEDAFRSRPIGFYAESAELSKLFKHDRILQSKLAPAIADEFAEALGAEASDYRSLIRLAELVTNPRAYGSVEDRDQIDRAVLPPSDSLEGRLIKELFSFAPVPPGFELVAEIVRRIRDGRLDTKPRENDGWYAWKQHASAALLLPDTEGLEVGPQYRKELEETFAALFALNRETHVKQLEAVAVAAGRPRPSITVTPRFTVEPLPELYARTADAYRFVRTALSASFGEDVIRGIEIDGMDAYDALLEMESIFRGAQSTARIELGQSSDDVMHRARFAAFATQAQRDPDLAYDMRVPVPLFLNKQTNLVRILATLGLETRSLRFDWVKPPTVHVNVDELDVRLGGARVSILSPITIECDVRVPPTREELREICDREREPTAIRAALEAR